MRKSKKVREKKISRSLRKLSGDRKKQFSNK
jgi:hypothetical protein